MTIMYRVLLQIFYPRWPLGEIIFYGANDVVFSFSFVKPFVMVSFLVFGFT